MFIILIITMITLSNCLEPSQDKIDDEVKKVIGKYISKIPDIEPQYVIHEGLSKVISRYFKEKISTFPLYRISLTLDRNPVKIPWTLANPPNIHSLGSPVDKETEKKGIQYKYVPQEKAE